MDPRLYSKRMKMKRKRRSAEEMAGARKSARGRSARSSFSYRRVALLAGLTVFGSLLLLLSVIFYFGRDLPSISQLEVYQPKLATKIYSIDGKVIKELYTQRRERVNLRDVPQHLINALIATEDKNYRNHWGIDTYGLLRAILVNVSSFQARQGASTLTQQLARNLYLGLQQTLSRKIKEALTAIQIERTYSKNEILEMYLTHMNFGNGAYGVKSAARVFFDKELQDLSVEESAYLIGHLKAPTYYANNKEDAEFRKDIILTLMVKRGFLDTEDYREISKREIKLRLKPIHEEEGIAPYFTEYVRQELEVLKNELKINIYEDGLKVYTTLDTRVQKAAENAVLLSQDVLDMLDAEGKKTLLYEKTKFGRKFLKVAGLPDSEIKNKAVVDSLIRHYATVQLSLVAQEPATGHILAMIGGREFGKFKFNHATQAKRQPGSTFKAFLFAAAVDNGYPPSYQVLNQDVVLVMPDGKRWNPRNYDGSRGGMTTLRKALANSLNLVSVRLIQQTVPPRQVINYAHKMGINTPLAEVDALALGVSDVIPLELTSAYSVFANQGIEVKPVSIIRIEDNDGNIIWQNVPETKEVISRETAYIMTNMMGTGINEGTGRGARTIYNFKRPAASKTGTTQGFTDGWFVGFTPQIIASVWIGFDDYEMTLGEDRPGSVVATPIWARFMKEAHERLKLPVKDFPMPGGIIQLEICDDTKQLANPLCPRKVTEIFNVKYTITEHCEQHTGLNQTPKKKKNSGY